MDVGVLLVGILVMENCSGMLLENGVLKVCVYIFEVVLIVMISVLVDGFVVNVSVFEKMKLLLRL